MLFAPFDQTLTSIVHFCRLYPIIYCEKLKFRVKINLITVCLPFMKT